MNACLSASHYNDRLSTPVFLIYATTLIKLAISTTYAANLTFRPFFFWLSAMKPCPNDNVTQE